MRCTLCALDPSQKVICLWQTSHTVPQPRSVLLHLGLEWSPQPLTSITRPPRPIICKQTPQPRPRRTILCPIARVFAQRISAPGKVMVRLACQWGGAAARTGRTGLVNKDFYGSMGSDGEGGGGMVLFERARRPRTRPGMRARTSRMDAPPTPMRMRMVRWRWWRGECGCGLGGA
ncbi:hypothetical protein M427DRAFT_426543 [Gonapodya prolifera JEL478]|uniref:Uncharacterized protein n=1 Tax=Gonapodya prolifera (strain JEL478) TaxID=1344416 RepID=A0A139A4L8_GONPJ|nr:hypothetical protein M427DRAFT_426543 [Gonapodya prolifera JEL478]|eukprot:KXS11674.1 hypothetical protein M427DRAFT_426543 [Gonapodya prolifera JEL478]